jgi:hypothetical protein
LWQPLASTSPSNSPDVASPRIGINVYYKWLKDFMEADKGRLKGDTLRKTNRAELETLKQENQRLKELVA